MIPSEKYIGEQKLTPLENFRKKVESLVMAAVTNNQDFPVQIDERNWVIGTSDDSSFISESVIEVGGKPYFVGVKK